MSSFSGALCTVGGHGSGQDTALARDSTRNHTQVPVIQPYNLTFYGYPGMSPPRLLRGQEGSI